MSRLHRNKAEMNLEAGEVRVRFSMLEALRLMSEGKSIDDVATALHVNRANLYRSLKKFREKDYPALSRIVDIVEREKLLERKQGGDTAKKIIETKIRNAEKGRYCGPHCFGLRIRNGTLVKSEGSDKVKAVFESYIRGAGIKEVAKEFDLSITSVRHILKNTLYKGEFVYRGTSYKGNWEPLVDPELWDKAQRRSIPRGLGRLPFGYFWLDGRACVRPEAKETFAKIFDMRLKRNLIKEISKEVGLKDYSVDKILGDARVAGKAEVDGKLVSGIFEPAVDESTWRAAQKIRTSGIVKNAEHGKEVRRRIMMCVPEFRWELVEKVSLVDSAVIEQVEQLKSSGLLKEREDGLLQKSWEPFPESVVETRFKEESRRRQKIVSILLDGEASLGEISWIVEAPRGNVQRDLSELVAMNLVIRERQRYRLSKYGENLATKLPKIQVSLNERKLIRILSRRFTKNSKKILEILLTREADYKELSALACISSRNACSWLKSLKEHNIVEKRPGKSGKWLVRSEFIEPVQKGLVKSQLR